MSGQVPDQVRFLQFDYMRSLEVRLAQAATEERLSRLFELKYKGLSNLTSGDALFDNARVLAERLDVHRILADFLFANTQGSYSRQAWEYEMRIAFAIHHITHDCEMPLEELSRVFSASHLEEVAGTMRASRGALVLLAHVGHFTNRLTPVIDRAVPNTYYISGSRAEPNWSGTFGERAALFAALNALRSNKHVFLALDMQQGALTERMTVLGKQVELGSGAAFIAYETGCPTFFFAVGRNDTHLLPVVTEGPRRRAGEAFTDFRERIVRFYEAMVNAAFVGDPRNLAFVPRWSKAFRT